MTSSDSPMPAGSTDASPVIESAHQRLKNLFDAVCELPAHAQRARLIALRATQNEIERVEKLLKIDITTGDVSTTPRLGKPVVQMLESISALELKPGDKLGPWRLAEKIGEGGMGAVYLALRDDGQFSQVAALKLLAGMTTASTLVHLARERQILATLSHPNIARLIDGGTTPRGRPYLVMDYIEGVDIDRYCREQGLSVQAIIKLFCTVCETVSYAHQRLTLHCDLKPSNILVDVAGRPILLDFGISQMFDTAQEHATGPQRAAIHSFTPRYASPEQLSGAPLSTATDVFSLGRMLAQLLDATTAEKKWARECRVIVARATAEDVNYRYPSAQALATDLMRLLASKPLDAVGHQPVYIIRKFLERRWGSVAIGCAFVLMAVGLTTGALIQRDRAVSAERQARTELDRALTAEDQFRTERDRAQVAEVRALGGERDANLASVDAKNERDRAVRAEKLAENEIERALRAEAKTMFEADTTREVRDFLIGLFKDVDPAIVGSRKMTAFDLLERGRNRIDRTLEDQPALQSTMFATLGRIYENIGHQQHAKQLYRQAEALERDPDRGRPLVLAQVLSHLAILEANISNPAAGEALARESLAIRRKLAGENSLATADAHNTLGVVLSELDMRRESEQHLMAALKIREHEVGLISEEGASTLHNLGLHFRRFDDFDRAESYYRRALDIKRKVFADHDPKILNSLEGLAIALARGNRLSEAETLLSEAYKLRIELHGPQSDKVAFAANEWASVLQDMGRYPAAQRLYETAINIDSLLTGSRTVAHAIRFNNLASLFEDMGDYSAAETHYRTSLAIRSMYLKAGDVALARAHYNLGKLLLKRNSLREAEIELSTALRLREAKLDGMHQDIFDARLMMAELAVCKHDLGAAQENIAIAKKALDTVRPNRKIAFIRLDALVKEAQGDLTNALALWEQRAMETHQLNGEQHPYTLIAKLDWADALAKTGDTDKARVLAAVLKPALTKVLAEQAPQLDRVANLLNLAPGMTASDRSDTTSSAATAAPAAPANLTTKSIISTR